MRDPLIVVDVLERLGNFATGLHKITQLDRDVFEVDARFLHGVVHIVDDAADEIRQLRHDLEHQREVNDVLRTEIARLENWIARTA